MRRKMRNSIGLVVAAMFALGWVLSACGSTDAVPEAEANETIPLVLADTAVMAEGNLVPADSASLFVPVAAKVAEILVEEGEQIQAGQLLVRMGDREALEAGIAAAEIELESAQQMVAELHDLAVLAADQAHLSLLEAEEAWIVAQQRWREFDNSDFIEDLDEAEIDVIEAQEDLENAQEDFAEYQNLDEDNNTRIRYEDALENAKDDFEDAVWARDILLIQQQRQTALFEAAKNQIEEAERQFNAVKTGPDPDELALAEARLENANVQLAAAQAALERYDIRAPFSGTIVEIYVMEEEVVSPGKVAVLIADFSSWHILTSDLTELDVVMIEEGDNVSVRADALPDLALSGTVTEIADVFQERLGDVTYPVRIQLEDVDERLRWGMTLTVTFEEKNETR